MTRAKLTMVCALFQITESLDDVEVTEDGDLNIYKDEKKSSQSWIFMVKTKVIPLCYSEII